MKLCCVPGCSVGYERVALRPLRQSECAICGFRPLRGGAQKGTKKNCTPVVDSTIDSLAQNGLPQPCGDDIPIFNLNYVLRN